MSHFANLILGAHTAGLLRGKAALEDTTKAGKVTDKAVTGVKGGFKRAGDAAQAATPKVAGFAKAADRSRGMALAATKVMAGMAAAIATLGVSTRILADYDKQMAKVGAVSRATAGEIEAMRKVTAKLGATTEFTAKQAGAGMEFLARAGFSASESIETLPAVLDLATAAAMELGQAADTSSNIMSAFGIEAQNAAAVADVLAAASARANTDVGQLGAAMAYVGPVAAALDISMSDAAAAIGVLSDAGIQGSAAGTGLRRVLSTLANATPAATTAIENLGLSLDVLNPQTHSLTQLIDTLAGSGMNAAAAMKIFGDRGGPAILALTSQAPRLRELTGELSNVTGEAERMATAMRDNLGGDLDGLWSSLQGIIISLGEAGLTVVLRGAVQAATALARAVTGIVDAFAFVGGGIAGFIGDLFTTKTNQELLAAAIDTSNTAMSSQVQAADKASAAILKLNTVSLESARVKLINAQAARDELIAIREQTKATSSYAVALAAKHEEIQSRRRNIAQVERHIEETRADGNEVTSALTGMLDRQNESLKQLYLTQQNIRNEMEAQSYLSVEQQASLESTNAAIATLENGIATATGFMIDLTDRTGGAADAADRLLVATAQTYAQIPALKQLSAEYGVVGVAMRGVLDVQNQIAAADASAGIAKLAVDAANLTKELGFSHTQATDFKARLAEIDAMDTFHQQSVALADMANEIIAASGGVASLSADAREAVDNMLNAALGAAELNQQIAIGVSNSTALGAALVSLAPQLAPAISAATTLANVLSGALGTLGRLFNGLATLSPALSGVLGTLGSMKAAGGSVVSGAISGLSSMGSELGDIFDLAKRADGSAAAFAKSLKDKFNPAVAGSGGGGRGGAAGAVNKLAKEIERLEFDADPMKKYNAALEHLNELSAAGLSDGAYRKAVEDLNESLIDQVPLVNDVANAFGDFIGRGLTDFKSFARSILSSFTGMISKMISTAAKSRIMLSMGIAAPAGAASAGGAGGASAATGILGKIGGIGGALIGGFSNSIGALFGSGGGLGSMFSTIGGQLSVATSSLTGFAGAIGAIAAPLAIVAGLFSFFKKKTTLLNTGIRVTIADMETLVDTFSTIKTSKFWGLSKSIDTYFTPAELDVAEPFILAVNGVADSVKGAVKSLGLSSAAINSMDFQFSIDMKGKSESEWQKQLETELSSFADAAARQVVGNFTETVFNNDLIASLRGKLGNSTPDRGMDNSGYYALRAQLDKALLGTIIVHKSAVGDMFEELRKSGESANDTLQRLSTSLISANTAFDTLGTTLFEASVAGAGHAAALMDAFGGIEAFSQLTSGYFDTFYSEQEKLEILARQVTEQFGALNLTLPATRDGYRALIEAQDLTTEAGREAYASLVAMYGAIDQIIPVADAATSVIDGFAEALALAEGSANSALSAVRQAVDAEKAIVQARINGLRDERSQISKMESASRTLANKLLDAAEKLQNAILSPQQQKAQLAGAMGILRGAMASGSGIETSRSLEQALSIVSGQGTDGFATALDYKRQTAQAAYLTDQIALSVMTDAEFYAAQIEAMDAQILAAESELVALDLIYENALEQLNVLMGIHAGVLSIPAALSVLGSAMASLAAAQSAAANNTAKLSAQIVALNTGNGRPLSPMSVPKVPIPKFATGTMSAPGGVAMVGEQGPELVDLPQGSRVYNSRQTKSMGDAETKALRDEIAELKGYMRAVALNTGKSQKIQKKWDSQGSPETRDVDA